MTARPWVKVCGMTRLADALAAVEAGARAIGFILTPRSPRYVSVETAAAIAAALPPDVARVGVVVDMPLDTLRSTATAIGLTAIQAHGSESAAYCREVELPLVKALATRPGLALDDLTPFAPWPILLDGYASGTRGGTGTLADHDLAREAVRSGFRVVLAGGLGPENLADAVRRVEPLAVDLNSGVEERPGIKDPDRIRASLATLMEFETKELSWPW